MLEIKFWRIENSIVMKVLNQGEEIERGNFEFKASNGIVIKSDNRPLIASNHFFVRGANKEFDNMTSADAWFSVETAKKTLKMYIEAIQEYNNSLSLQKSEDIGKDIEVVIAK